MPDSAPGMAASLLMPIVLARKAAYDLRSLEVHNGRSGAHQRALPRAALPLHEYRPHHSENLSEALLSRPSIPVLWAFIVLTKNCARPCSAVRCASCANTQFSRQSAVAFGLARVVK